MGAALLLSAKLHAQGVFRQPLPGEVYKEYAVTVSLGNDDWRVTDPNINLTTYPAAADFLPNPVMSFTIDDLDQATKAEALFALWGGHIGTTGKKVAFNGNAWITIPELTSTPTAGYNYIHQAMIGVAVPLAHLVQGTNTFTGTNTGQVAPYGFGWGQFGWYAMVLRVYYNPATKTHATGTITSPGNGSTFGDSPTINVSVNGSANRVDVLAYYDGYDTDGDGIYAEYHHDYHRDASESTTIRNHVGTDESSPFSLTWNNTWVPDQSGIKLLARIRGTNNVWYVTPEITNLTLSRGEGSVVLYKPTDVGEREWARGDINGGTQESYVNIPSLAGASAAVFIARTWNAVDGDGDPAHYTRVNNWYAPAYGDNHYYSLDYLAVPVGSLQTGSNLIQFKSNTTAHHGIEILWPGSAVAVRFNVPLPIQLASLSAAAAGENGVLVTWRTLSETNNYGFEVQRAISEPADFVAVPGGFVQGAGTTLEPRSYSFTDPAKPAGVVYYRLKQIDLDGTEWYSEAVRVDALTDVARDEVPATYSLGQAYPNPFNPSTRIRFALPESGQVRLLVYNQLGQVVKELVNGFRSAGYHEVTFDTAGLPSGVYLYRMESGPFMDVKKAVLVR
ncbi:MAG: T9SS type A sorting domain-containing protein [Bacteroidetes bacterium]|nr:T9SS type A sorting domain-containing protein [Bacteroidota bacterium]